MQKSNNMAGREELLEARRRSRAFFWFVGIFSFFANMLMLTGPLYMLQVYDRVLSSRSEATLLALTVIVLFLYGVMGVLDFARGRVMGRVGARFQADLDDRVFRASLKAAARKMDGGQASGMSHLEAYQRYLTSPVFLAFFDLPWTPIFLFGIALFHPWLGMLAVGGGAVLIAIALTAQLLLRRPTAGTARHAAVSDRMANSLRNEAEMIQSMGMIDAALRRWKKARMLTLRGQIDQTDLSGGFTSLTKSFRLFLQSAMLGLGAYLVLQDQLTPGAMIAGSILLGRALAPIEIMVSQWPMAQRGRQGWTALEELLGDVPVEPQRTPLPAPQAKLEVQQLTVVPPGEQQASLRMVSFGLKPGQAIGVIGPSGAGKTTLARALTGLWRPAGGRIRLDGATLDQYDPEALGVYVGYLPQKVELFDGTIADNIAKLSETPDPEKIVQAAKTAAAHEMILKFPDGYDTRVDQHGGRLSGGQMQRIGLARALYSEPVLLVLDEPNSNLDNEGTQAVNQAIRAQKARGGCALIMAHRPDAIRECDLLLVLDQGARTAFGPRDEVLQKTVTNAKQIQRADGKGAGVS
ncbi:type I secretion system permease/ATPase [Primorskyibacter sp. S187A]|uniref:type I secretion system permease/ATPase n=1 Tax=Primorskyibacter sp. S187A TaxID=3415130 RepID=UPI003C79A605